jgi:hypothetical protein
MTTTTSTTTTVEHGGRYLDRADGAERSRGGGRTERLRHAHFAPSCFFIRDEEEEGEGEDGRRRSLILSVVRRRTTVQVVAGGPTGATAAAAVEGCGIRCDSASSSVMGSSPSTASYTNDVACSTSKWQPWRWSSWRSCLPVASAPQSASTAAAEKEDSDVDLGNVDSHSVDDGGSHGRSTDPRRGEDGVEVGDGGGRWAAGGGGRQDVIFGSPARKRRRTIAIDSLERIAHAIVNVDAGVDIHEDGDDGGGGGGGTLSRRYLQRRSRRGQVDNDFYYGRQGYRSRRRSARQSAHRPDGEEDETRATEKYFVFRGRGININ